MKITSLYNIKKTYRKPAIEEVELDVAITLTGITICEGECDELPDFTDNSSEMEKATKSPDYGSLNYKQAENPFGNSPKY
ncbi:hypothetical protein [Alkaliflexus imshenetskii]|jgi:hypothetical protein|uniref:hypothetical protein n=1 Tax=Alkaliflexus imshenetskii TaxID=286730 RepID=UPI000479AECA|nr:hypothetical protein [Alkaliflexus imshenetskii]